MPSSKYHTKPSFRFYLYSLGIRQKLTDQFLSGCFSTRFYLWVKLKRLVKIHAELLLPGLLMKVLLPDLVSLSWCINMSSVLNNLLVLIMQYAFIYLTMIYHSSRFMSFFSSWLGSFSTVTVSAASSSWFNYHLIDVHVCIIS